MRGSDAVAGSLFSYVDLEKRIRPDHPLRVIRDVVNVALVAMSAQFDVLYSPIGRESIPPEQLLRALLLQGKRPPIGVFGGWLRGGVEARQEVAGWRDIRGAMSVVDYADGGGLVAEIRQGINSVMGFMGWPSAILVRT